MVATPPKPTTDTSINAFGKARSTVEGAPLSAEELRKMHAFWRASNYLAVGMIYLRENPLLREFSFPGGVGSHCTPETPGSIHEGGFLGYSVSHAYGAAYDNPDTIVTVLVGDGESETGPLATEDAAH